MTRGDATAADHRICACGIDAYIDEAGTCYLCRQEQEDRDRWRTATGTPLTRAEALAVLVALRRSEDPEKAHQAAEVILLRLVQDPEITAAFAVVPKWYA